MMGCAGCSWTNIHRALGKKTLHQAENPAATVGYLGA